MPETSAIKALTRRVKAKALEKAEYILNNEDKVTPELFKETYLTVLKNSVPRTQEVTGEDGEPVRLVFDSVFKNGTTRQTETDSGESSQI